MSEQTVKGAVAVLGASSLVGSYVLQALGNSGHPVVAYTRSASRRSDSGVEWLAIDRLHLNTEEFPAPSEKRLPLPLWICAAPIWVLPEYLECMRQRGVRRLVAVSSTSVMTKAYSSDPEEQAVSQKLAAAEMRVTNWAEKHGIELVLLRPTLIYGNGQDKSVAEIARFIKRWGGFPVFGPALGLRQPVHAQDVANVCYAALMASADSCGAYAISGGETLPYREMVGRIFLALKKPPRFFNIPLIAFRAAITVLRLFPRYRQWTSAMAERMNADLVFDHREATEKFGFHPRPFSPSTGDVSSSPGVGHQDHAP